MYFLKFILCPLIVLMLAACGKHPQQANGHDLRACRPHLNGIIDGEKVVGSGRTSLIVGFAGTAVTSGGMVNYLFGPDPGSLAGPSTSKLSIRNAEDVRSLAIAREIAAEHDATFVFPNKSPAQGSQWPAATPGTGFFQDAVAYTDCLGEGFSRVFTLGYSNGGQTAGSVALATEKSGGVLFAAGQSQFDAATHVGISDQEVPERLADLSVVFFYYEGDETISSGLRNFRSRYLPHIRFSHMMRVVPKKISGTGIWPRHLTPMGATANGAPIRKAIRQLLDFPGRH